ncbi:hypothetical protein Taro_000404 [Colocasia esculenta]|uniref:CCHC-type domain-containing protein n=1 Tax=Colocasia esculenta TaxID=4460 RepID=A0A843TC27_COLES|nr:hypothetical protein [Colocasia esculenta]
MAPLVLVDVCLCAACRALGKHAGVSRLKATAEYVAFRARFDEFSPRGRYVERRKRRAGIVLRVLREGSKEFGVIRMMDFGLGFAPAKATTLGVATKSRHRDTSRSEGDLSCCRVLKATLHPVVIAPEGCYPRIHPIRGRRTRVRLAIRLTGLNGEDRHSWYQSKVRVVMAKRRNVGGGGKGSREDPTQRMIERIWESLTEIRVRLDLQPPVQPAAAVPPFPEEAVPVAPVPTPPGVEVPPVVPVQPAVPVRPATGEETTIQQMKREQFRTVQQGNLSVLEYQMRFIALSRYAPYVVTDNTMMVEYFIRVLRAELQDAVIPLMCRTVEEAAQRAAILERTVRARQGQSQTGGLGSGSFRHPQPSGGISKGKAPSGASSSSGIENWGKQIKKFFQGGRGRGRQQGFQQGGFQQDRGYRPPVPEESQQSTIGQPTTYPAFRCYACGQPGHLARNCPYPREQTYGRGTQQQQQPFQRSAEQGKVDVCMCTACRALGKHAGVSRLKATAEYVAFRARFDEFSLRGCYVERRKRRAGIVLREGSKEFGVIRMMDFGLGFAPAKATTLGIATKSRHRDTSRSEVERQLDLSFVAARLRAIGVDLKDVKESTLTVLRFSESTPALVDLNPIRESTSVQKCSFCSTGVDPQIVKEPTLDELESTPAKLQRLFWFISLGWIAVELLLRASVLCFLIFLWISEAKDLTLTSTRVDPRFMKESTLAVLSFLESTPAYKGSRPPLKQSILQVNQSRPQHSKGVDPVCVQFFRVDPSPIRESTSVQKCSFCSTGVDPQILPFAASLKKVPFGGDLVASELLQHLKIFLTALALWSFPTEPVTREAHPYLLPGNRGLRAVGERERVERPGLQDRHDLRIFYTIYAIVVDRKKGDLGVIARITIGFIVGANILAGGAFDGESMNPAVSFDPTVVS